MFIIVSDDRSRVPSLGTDQVIEQWTLKEFVDNASGDGLDYYPDAIYVNVTYCPQKLYQALKEWEKAVTIIYFRFADEPLPTYPIESTVQVFAVPMTQPTEQPMVDVPEIEEPQPDPIEEPIIDEQPDEPVMVQMQPQETMQTVEPQPIVETPQVEMPSETPTVSQTNEPQVDNTFQSHIPIEESVLMYDDWDTQNELKKTTPAKVFLFGSSKGGTGKTFTCLATARRYAQTHPTKKIAVADFDIIDGQVGISLGKVSPTIQEYYRLYVAGRRNFQHLENNKLKSDKFPPNVDFYLPPSQDIPQITNNEQFWNDVFDKLIRAYDVVFFDSGIDYLGKPPISRLYKIADKIVITSTPNINAIKSNIKQIKTLSGQRQNPVFQTSDKVQERLSSVLTRVSNDKDDAEINNIVERNLTQFSPIIARFPDLDKVIRRIQWYQRWDLIDTTPALQNNLDLIIKELDK